MLIQETFECEAETGESWNSSLLLLSLEPNWVTCVNDSIYGNPSMIDQSDCYQWNAQVRPQKPPAALGRQRETQHSLVKASIRRHGPPQMVLVCSWNSPKQTNGTSLWLHTHFQSAMLNLFQSVFSNTSCSQNSSVLSWLVNQTYLEWTWKLRLNKLHPPYGRNPVSGPWVKINFYLFFVKLLINVFRSNSD